MIKICRVTLNSTLVRKKISIRLLKQNKLGTTPIRVKSNTLLSKDRVRSQVSTKDSSKIMQEIKGKEEMTAGLGLRTTKKINQGIRNLTHQKKLAIIASKTKRILMHAHLLTKSLASNNHRLKISKLAQINLVMNKNIPGTERVSNRLKKVRHSIQQLSITSSLRRNSRRKRKYSVASLCQWSSTTRSSRNQISTRANSIPFTKSQLSEQISRSGKNRTRQPREHLIIYRTCQQVPNLAVSAMRTARALTVRLQRKELTPASGNGKTTHLTLVEP